MGIGMWKVIENYEKGEIKMTVYEKILEKSDTSFKQQIYLKINKLRNFNKKVRCFKWNQRRYYNGNISWNQFINNLIDKKDYIFCEIDFILESFNKKQII